MWICNDCGHTFEEPVNEQNRSVSVESEYAECPRCGSDDFDEAFVCTGCGKWFADTDLYYGLCKSCLADKAKEYAAEFVMNDPSIRSDFAWWLKDKLEREGR